MTRYSKNPNVCWAKVPGSRTSTVRAISKLIGGGIAAIAVGAIMVVAAIVCA